MENVRLNFVITAALILMSAQRGQYLSRYLTWYYDQLFEYPLGNICGTITATNSSIIILIVVFLKVVVKLLLMKVLVLTALVLLPATIAYSA